MTRLALFTAALSLSLSVACSMDSSLTQFGEEAAFSDTGAPAGQGGGGVGAPDDQGGGDPMGGEGPVSCASDDDCGPEACPPEAIDCVCSQSPMGDAICVPGCEVDADCPSGPMGEVMICEAQELVCVPEEMM